MTELPGEQVGIHTSRPGRDQPAEAGPVGSSAPEKAPAHRGFKPLTTVLAAPLAFFPDASLEKAFPILLPRGHCHPVGSNTETNPFRMLASLLFHLKSFPP